MEKIKERLNKLYDTMAEDSAMNHRLSGLYLESLHNLVEWSWQEGYKEALENHKNEIQKFTKSS